MSGCFENLIILSLNFKIGYPQIRLNIFQKDLLPDTFKSVPWWECKGSPLVCGKAGLIMHLTISSVICNLTQAMLVSMLVVVMLVSTLSGSLVLTAITRLVWGRDRTSSDQHKHNCGDNPAKEREPVKEQWTNYQGLCIRIINLQILETVEQ